MLFRKIFFENYLLMLPIVSWCVAQVMKTAIYFFINNRFSGERLFGAGGMPSSHSALVCSLFIGTAKKFGLASPYFAFAFAFAAIVMYDAMGVRQEAGKQAKVLNLILDDLREENQALDSEKRLRELIGHTPLQVLSGALLGILIGILIPVF